MIVTSAVRFAVSFMTRDFSPLGETGKRMVTSGWERVCLDERRHAVVLALPFARALGLAAVGIGLMAIGWPASIAGVALQGLGAFVALRAVWNWEQTRVVLTTDKLFVVHGTLRKHAAAVRLARIGTVEIEQGLIGRLLGYGTIVAGDLEIEYVLEPRRVYGLVERLSA
jgi:membrane protein YdbS with pleckstrin-like domain